MKAEIIYLSDQRSAGASPETVLSLGRFAAFIRERVQQEKGAKVRFFEYMLEQMALYPELEKEIPLEKIVEYKDILEFIQLALLPPVTDENDKYWALSLPFSPVIFYGTRAIYHFLTDKEGFLRGSIIHSMTQEEKVRHLQSICYTLALDRLYQKKLPVKLEVYQYLSAGVDNLQRAYKVQFDSSFVEVRFSGTTLPDLNLELIEVHDNLITQEGLQLLQEALPLELIRFEGFSVVQVSDVTAKRAIENIKNSIVNLKPGVMVYDEVAEAIKSLIGSSHVIIRLIPMLRVNNRMVLDDVGNMGKQLREICTKNNVREKVYLEAVERFFKHPEMVLDTDVREATAPAEAREMYRMMENMGVKGLMIQPVYFNKQLVGIFEVFAQQKGIVVPDLMTTVDPVIPLLEQLFQAHIDDFDASLDKVVKDRFTSLQPSVQWAFTEAAWQFLQKRKLDKKAQIGRIRFEEVYPLYGAIDVRNSTIQRNLALKQDLHKQLNLLVELLQQLKKVHFLTIIDEMIFKSRGLIQQIDQQFGTDEQYEISQFLESEIVAFLLHYHENYKAAEPLINQYYMDAGPGGFAYQNRDDLEQSLGLLNATIGSLLDRMNDEIQMEYPCYFEKFRSDGVEYDIYIGQSITPERSFDPMYLRNLRLWQLTSMALVARLTRALIPQMKKRLETTQLIFIHAGTIDIEFRNDEHRFDVEGAYNIRYEIIKKRIDKVHLKDSEERLTQPGKIALVYFQPRDIEEYLGYIRYLQQQNVLLDDLEYLELEELQGVAGLKALRIGVNMETEDMEA
jgi:hypothetical protein